MRRASDRMSWLRRFAIICASVLVLVVIALVLLVSFLDLGLSRHGITALFIGVLLTVALTMVLMGLVFLSSRGGYDEGERIADPDSEHQSAPLAPGEKAAKE